jgi:DNA-binding MarR family transcriptional regulator
MGVTPHQIAEAWCRERPGAATRSIPAVSAVKRAAKHLERTRERTLKQLGVDAATLDLLSTLRRSGPPYTLSTREIAEQTLVTAGAISQRLARAERGDLVRRRPVPHGRGVLVELTPAGHALVERVVDDVLAADDAATAALTDDELDQLERLLSRLSG